MSFEIETMTKARMHDVLVLSQKNRKPDEEPGAKLSIGVKLSSECLAGFDGSLKSFLFTKNANQSKVPKTADLEGFALSDMPNLTGVGAHVKTLKWDAELLGYLLTIHGVGVKDIAVDDCKISKFRIEPQEGGTVLLKFAVESPNVSGPVWGKLAKLKSCEVDVTLLPGETEQGELADDKDVAWPFPGKNPGKANGGAPPRHLAEERDPGPAPIAAAKKKQVRPGGNRKVPAKKAASIKYRDAATGETWSGRGLQPKWIKAALLKGKSLLDFAQ